MRSASLSVRVVLLIAIVASLGACSFFPLGRTEARSTEVVTVNGTPQVIIENLNGNVEVATGPDGKVSAEIIKWAAAGGPGQLDLISFAFSADSQTVRGKVSWTSDKSMSSVGCDLKITVPAGSSVTVTDGNGDLSFNGAPTIKALSLRTGNGKVTVTLPKDTQFALKASVGNGQVNSDFALAGGRGSNGGRSLEGTYGANPTLGITATIGNGNVTIKQGR